MTEGRTFSIILIATDGSDQSMTAADYAISVAKVYHARLIVLHVIPSDVTLFGPSILSHMDDLKKEAQIYLDNLLQRAKADKNDIQVESKIISSPSVVGGIVNIAESENVDLVIVGTKGRTGFKKLLLGSVASGVATYAPCPVMIVK